LKIPALYPKSLLLAVFCTMALWSAAQQVWVVRAEHPMLKPLLDNRRFNSKNEATELVKSTYSKFLAKGYLDAKLDTVWHQQMLECTFIPGKKYENVKLVWSGNASAVRLLKLPPDVSAANTELEIERVLAYCENHGFPFCHIAFLNMTQDSSRTTVEVQLDLGPKIELDSLIVRTDDKLPVNYLSSYLNLKKGEDYNEAKLVGLEKKLKEIPFITPLRSPEVLFKNGKADYYLFLKKKKANSFNGILGIRPNEQTGGVFFTGDVEVKLLNAMNRGDDFYFNWRRMQVQTQDLQLKAAFPFIFKLPVGIEGNLKIYRRDSTFTTLKTALAATFQMGGGNALKLILEKNDIAKLGTLNTSSSLANVNSTLYGLGMVFSKLDYRINPRRGFATEWNALVGKRTVRVNESTPSSPSPLYRFEWNAEVFLPLFKHQCIRIGNLGSSYIANTIYTNEMYRIGGLRTLRGFSEEVLFATTYSVASFEYRYLFEENSAVYLFTDAAWYEKTGTTNYVRDTPLGFGAGVNFETKSGIFTFNYALGSEFNNPILVRNAKISFGFRNVF
jgi:outer membrane protein assembly factor BamA